DAYEIDDNAFVEAGEEQETEEQPEEETSLEGSVDSEEMPDLDSLDLSEETAGLDEGDLSELPDMDFDTFNEDLEQGEDAGEVIGGIEPELGEIPEQSDEDELSSLGSEMDELENTDFGSLDELPSVDEIEAPAVSETAEPVDDLEPIESVSGLEDDLPDLSTDVPGIEPVDEDQDERPAAERKGLDFTPDELKKIKKALILFPIGLTDAIKDTILNDRLGETDTRRLADMILEGRPEDNIHRFLEKRLKQKIDKEGGRGASRRVIMSRPEYSREGRERQQVLLRRTRNIALGAAAALVIGIGAYRMIYVPQKANSLIAEGTRLIRRFSEEKFPDYQRAEEIFTLVDEKYIKDYIYAYNEYGRAYFDKQEYYRSLMKLNKAYDLAVEKGFNTAESVRTLNELGYFYSAKKRDREDAPGNFDDFFQKSVKLNLDEYYFNKIPPLGTVNTQYDLALDFYQKALNRDPDNIRSLLGIGDVYQNQGQFLKARQYYENILEIDRDSIAGHAGLLNLFIEQDNFSETVTEFVNLRNRKNLKELPSALLAKLANYLLSKTKTESTNIRIEYGIQSPRLKDSNDQPFPAVVEVLKALREKDPDYPPLYTAYARLSLKQKNIKLAKEYLENGLKRSAKQGYPFFAGHHMMGEYYFYTKQPDAAYDHFRKALKDQKSPPEYTYDRYYEEQEEVGDTYAMLGNIFYYFFDEVRFRTGDQETVSEIEMRQNQDMMGNFNIAGDYYEEALQSGYESPEVHYNLGRIHYLNRLYAQARDQWLNLYDEFTTSPELMLGLGNVFYKLGNYDTAQSQFMKLTNIYEYEADRIREAQAENQTHNKVFGTLSSAYNNLGAVYQKQGELEKSAISYWNAIEYAQKINEENEFARVNLARGTREREEPVDPILDDNIPYSIDYYTEKMRW
ncbi:MAG: tetratricopeptide repeat protein, partial [Spirochaetota bacterium]